MQNQPGRFHAVRGLGSAFLLLAALVVVVQSVAVVLRWIGYRTVVARFDGAMSRDDYLWARNTLFPIEMGLWLLSFLAMLVAWIVLTVWLWRARTNTDTFSAATHHLSAPWAFWSWVVPVVSLWFPVVFVNDVDKASGPRRSRALIAIWWLAWILAWIVFWGGTFSHDLPDDHGTIQTMRDAEVDSLFIFSAVRTGSAVLFAVAAGCLAAGVLRISRAQAAWSTR